MRKLLIVLFLFTTTAAFASQISDKYAELGGATGPLGAALSPETAAADGGSVQHFKNGSIFWHPECGARAVRGAIRNRYKALGYETGFLGYPITDQLTLADGSGIESKFKGGQLMLRNGASVVTEVRSTDLVVDWPFPKDDIWVVGQTNAVTTKDSHGGPWAYCMDINFANGPTGGRQFVAAATSRLVHVDQHFNSGGDNPGNVVVQRFGEGRYGSYLHIAKESFTKIFANGGLTMLPQNAAWTKRAMPLSGTALGEVGDTGTGVGNHHMHFCVTTAPDRNEYEVPFESVPVSFRNYAVSRDQGKTWKFVPIGVPRSGEWVRRMGPRGVQKPVRIKGLPVVNADAATISHGVVKGSISASDGKPTGAGKLTVRVMSAWGEPLRTTTIDVTPNNLAGPWSFEVPNAPAYKKLKVSASYSGPWSKSFTSVSGESSVFDLAPDGTNQASVTLTTK